MEDYIVKLAVKNNLFLTHMKNAGYETIKSLSIASNVSSSQIGNIIALRTTLYDRCGSIRESFVLLAETLDVLPEELLPEQHHFFGDHLKRNTVEREVGLAGIQAIIDHSNTGSMIALENKNKNDDRKKIITEMLSTLNDRERFVVIRRFGLDGEAEDTFEQLSKKVPSERGNLSLNRERIRQIEAKALRKLKKIAYVANKPKIEIKELI